MLVGSVDDGWMVDGPVCWWWLVVQFARGSTGVGGHRTKPHFSSCQRSGQRYAPHSNSSDACVDACIPFVLIVVRCGVQRAVSTSVVFWHCSFVAFFCVFVELASTVIMAAHLVYVLLFYNASTDVLYVMTCVMRNERTPSCSCRQ